MPMSDILKSDIFFVVTTVAVVAVTVLLIIVLARLLGILKNVKKVSKLAGDGADAIREDLGAVRREVHAGAQQAKGEMADAFERGGIAGVAKLLLSYAYKGRKKRNKSPLRKK